MSHIWKITSKIFEKLEIGFREHFFSRQGIFFKNFHRIAFTGFGLHWDHPGGCTRQRKSWGFSKYFYKWFFYNNGPSRKKEIAMKIDFLFSKFNPYKTSCEGIKSGLVPAQPLSDLASPIDENGCSVNTQECCNSQ